MNQPTSPGAADWAAEFQAMRAEIAELRQRVAQLEAQAAQRPPVAEEIDEETLLAISAAVAAYLGVKASIRQVRLVHSSSWGQVGRMGVHASHRLT